MTDALRAARVALGNEAAPFCTGSHDTCRLCDAINAVEKVTDDLLREKDAEIEKSEKRRCVETVQLVSRIASLESEIARLRRWRCEQDCRFTMGDVADISGSHCPLDKPCARCEGERNIESIESEIAKLKADAADYDDSVREMRLGYESERGCTEMMIQMAIDSMGGTVEGAEPHRGNWLQRVRELVEKEAQIAKLKAVAEAAKKIVNAQPCDREDESKPCEYCNAEAELDAALNKLAEKDGGK